MFVKQLKRTVYCEVAGFNDIRIKEKPIKEKTFKETDKKKQVINVDVKKGIRQKMMSSIKETSIFGISK